MHHAPENIDDLFKKRLHDSAVAPPPFVWDKVEKTLRKRRRRFIFWMFFFGGGVLLTGARLYTGYAGKQTAALLRADRGQTLAAVLPVTEDTTAVAYTTAPSTVSSFNEKNNSAASAVSQQLNPASTTAKGARDPFASGRRAALLPAQSAIPPEQQESRALPAEGSQPQQFPEETAPGAATPELTPLPVHLFPLSPIAQHGLQPATVTGAEQMPAATKLKTKKVLKNCYDFTHQPSVWMVEAFGGPSLSQRELVSSPDNKPYLNKRLSSEHRDLAFNAGLRASLMLKGNFLVRTGFQYDQMTEIFEYVDPDWVKTSVVYFTQNGHTTVDTIIEYGEQYQKIYNRFGMLDIPLCAGVEFRKGRTGFNINAGFSFNVLFWKRGAILSPDTDAPDWFTPEKGSWKVFRPHTGLSATSSIQWFYHIKPRWRVFVEPYFRRILRPVTLESHPVEQRYGLGGLRIGFTGILN